jgi:hypothetical protein
LNWQIQARLRGLGYRGSYRENQLTPLRIIWRGYCDFFVSSFAERGDGNLFTDGYFRAYFIGRSMLEKATQKKVELLAASLLAACYKLSGLLIDKIDRFFEQDPEHRDPDLILVNFNIPGP